MTKFTLNSKAYLQALNNLQLENFQVSDEIAQKAMAFVNEEGKLTPTNIKEVVNSGKI